MALHSRSPYPQSALVVKIFGITVGVTFLILMFLYAVYAGGRRDLRLVRLRSGGARRAGDPETGAGSAGRNNGSSESVDTLPRYTPGGQEGCVAPPEQSDEHDGVGGEGAKPPPYTLDAGGAVTEASNGGGRGEGHGGFPASPAPAHLQSS